MIKVRVEYHHKCPGCGTEIAIDFLGGPMDYQVCPWCGCTCEADQVEDTKLKAYIAKAVDILEKEANDRIAVKG